MEQTLLGIFLRAILALGTIEKAQEQQPYQFQMHYLERRLLWRRLIKKAMDTLDGIQYLDSTRRFSLQKGTAAASHGYTLM